MKGIKAYIADKIFTGEQWLNDHAIIVAEGIICGIIPADEVSSTLVTHDFYDRVIAPAFIDLQIYGAHGRLLSVYPEADSLYKLNDYSRSGGAANCLPTVATNSYQVFHQAIDAINDYWNKGGEGVLGIHLEGPWINPVKRGAHIESYIHTPSLQQAKDLLAYGKGIIKMITLAPEQCSDEVIDLILADNIVISAGHSNATYKEAKESFAKGVTAVTHLYNAMSALQHREPGLVGATMNDDKVMVSIIPDGYHVDYAAIQIAKAIMKDRLFVITDAVTDTHAGDYQHVLMGDKYETAGILSGSALTMSKAVQNLVNHVGVELGEAIRMCSLYPARLMGLDSELGKIEKGYKAKLVLLNEQNEVVKILE